MPIGLLFQDVKNTSKQIEKINKKFSQEYVLGKLA